MTDERKSIVIRGAQSQKFKKWVTTRDSLKEEYKQKAKKLHDEFWEFVEQTIPETADGNWTVITEHADAGVYILTPTEAS